MKTTIEILILIWLASAAILTLIPFGVMLFKPSHDRPYTLTYAGATVVLVLTFFLLS